MPSAARKPRTAGRTTRDDWLRAALSVLIQEGVDSVKVLTLADHLDCARSSFYWFFKDRAAILDALLDNWEQTNTAALVEGCDAYAETVAEALLNLISVFLDETRFEPRLDMAVRGWAQQSPAVAERVAQADAARLGAIRALFARFGFAPDEADVRARTVYLVQIGYIALQIREALEDRMARIPAYVKTYCGQSPTEAELARFHARHGL